MSSHYIGIGFTKRRLFVAPGDLGDLQPSDEPPASEKVGALSDVGGAGASLGFGARRR